MRAQLKNMVCRSTGAGNLPTCDVDYYHRQQALFVDFLDKAWSNRKNSKVNWDPVDMTVLANEQVNRWPRLALGRAGRAAGTDAMVLQDHRFLARPA